MKMHKISGVSFLASDKDYLTLTEVCVFFKRTRHTILRWRNNDEIGFPDPLKVGRRNLEFEKQKLLDWFNSLQDNEVEPIENQNSVVKKTSNQAVKIISVPKEKQIKSVREMRNTTSNEDLY